MFGGTRGKFNAMALLRDREMRQQQQMNRRSLRGKRSYEPAIQNFGDVREWNERKMGNSPAGGKDVGDDAVVEHMEEISDMNREMAMDAEFDPVMMEGPYDDYWEDDVAPSRTERGRRSRRDRFYEDDEDDDFDFELERRSSSRRRRGGRSGRGERRRGWFSLPESARERAAAYDRSIGLGPDYDDDDDLDDEYDTRRSRRRSGYAYKMSRDELDYEDDYDFDDDVIDVRPKRSLSRRRSWEERAMEMDRIPPRSVSAWGPNGRADRDAQSMAAIDAEREIEKASKYLEKKEDMVDDAKEEVISLKA
jgi:hypothetical protein